jgi:hypothetical protein
MRGFLFANCSDCNKMNANMSESRDRLTSINDKFSQSKEFNELKGKLNSLESRRLAMQMGMYDPAFYEQGKVRPKEDLLKMVAVRAVQRGETDKLLEQAKSINYTISDWQNKDFGLSELVPSRPNASLPDFSPAHVELFNIFYTLPKDNLSIFWMDLGIPDFHRPMSENSTDLAIGIITWADSPERLMEARKELEREYYRRIPEKWIPIEETSGKVNARRIFQRDLSEEHPWVGAIAPRVRSNDLMNAFGDLEDIEGTTLLSVMRSLIKTEENNGNIDNVRRVIEWQLPHIQLPQLG